MPRIYFTVGIIQFHINQNMAMMTVLSSDLKRDYVSKKKKEIFLDRKKKLFSHLFIWRVVRHGD